MKLSEFKQRLQTVDKVRFALPDGTPVPAHFHVTEIGVVTKHFIDCGGTVRTEQAVNFQLWNAHDFLHRLKPEKLLRIIALSESTLGIADLDIEVEYQAETIGRYGLGFHDGKFLLQSKSTACLAQDSCGTGTDKVAEKQPAEVCCAPGSGCC